MSDRMLVAVTHLADFLVVGAFGLKAPTVAAVRAHNQAPETWPISRTSDSLGGRYEEAFANAVAAHTLDWDDVMLGVPNHPGTIIWPTLFATAPKCTTIRDAAEGFLEGVGMAAELGDALGVEHYRRGWHATATIGRMAAAYAGGYTRYRDTSVAWSAMQLASIGSSGVSDVFGTSVKPAQVGMAAAGAAQAVHLIESIDDMPEVMVPDSKLGEILGVRRPPGRCERYDSPAVTSDLRVKTYPACYYAHAPIHATSRLERTDFESARSITVTVSPDAARVCKVDTPRSIDEARFSLSYLVAAAGMTWEDDTLGLIDGSILTSRSVSAVAHKVSVDIDTGIGDMEAVVVVDGRESRVDLGLSSPGLSRSLVGNKARHESIRNLLPTLIIEFLESEDGPTPEVLDLPLRTLLVPVPTTTTV